MNKETKIKNIKNRTRKVYSTRHIVKKFSEIGLWKSEKILIDKYFKKKSSILDVGCGGGRVTIPLIKKGYDIVGIDIDRDIISNAKLNAKKYNVKIKYYVMDATNLKFKNNSFDNAIFAWTGLECIPHSENREKALKEINRVLKEKGRFILTTHSALCPPSFMYVINSIYLFFKFYIAKLFGVRIWELEYGDIKYKEEGIENFIHLSNPNTIKKQLKQSGFRLLEFIPKTELEKGKKSFFSKSPFRYTYWFYVVEKI